MNRAQLGIVVFLVAALVGMLIFPPYFGMDMTSGGQIHGVLGYHPAWSAPSQERAYAILSDIGVLPDSGVRASDLAIRKNVIRLTLNALSLTVLCIIGVVLLRSRKSVQGPGEKPAVEQR